MHGFTPIELLTVIAIIGILAAVIIPTTARVRDRAKMMQCTARMRTWGQAVRLFSNDFKGDVALTLSVGDASSNTGHGKLYSPYLNAVRMVAEGTTDGTTIDPMNYYSRCPAYVGGGTEVATRRQMCFVIPDGSKRTADADTRFARKSIGAIYYYNISDAKSPSNLYLMMETIVQEGEKNIQYNSMQTDISTLVVPVCNSSDKSIIRHGGLINVLYLDGHMATHKATDVDISKMPSDKRQDFQSRFRL